MTEPKMCELCGGSGKITDLIGYATREMAMDAGDMAYEGYPIYGDCPCPECHGDGWFFEDEPEYHGEGTA